MNNKKNLIFLSILFLFLVLFPVFGLAYIPEPIPPPPPPPPPSPVTKTPYYYYTSQGSEEGGGLSSFQKKYSDVIYWTDTSYEYKGGLICYNIEFGVYFKYPSAHYSKIYLKVRYKLDSIAVLNLAIRYMDDPSHTVPLPDTGGTYVDTTIPITSNGHVWLIEAACSPMRPWYLGPPPQPWVYIDYMAIQYKS